MAVNVAPQTVTIYDVIKDLGFPIAVSLILLFQIGPKLDAVITTNAQLEAQLGIVAADCQRSN